MTVGEAIGITLDETPHAWSTSDRHELNMIFNFDAVRHQSRMASSGKTWTLPELKAIYDRQRRGARRTQTGTPSSSPTTTTRASSPASATTPPEFRVPSAKLLATMLLTLRGTPFIYQGDELGMTNYPFKTHRRVQRHRSEERLQSRRPDRQDHRAADYIANLRHIGRDNARTPMQWDRLSQCRLHHRRPSPGWPSIRTTNRSMPPRKSRPRLRLQLHPRMIALRAQTPAFVYGDYKDLDPQHPQIFAYTRTLGRAVPRRPQLLRPAHRLHSAERRDRRHIDDGQLHRR